MCYLKKNILDIHIIHTNFFYKHIFNIKIYMKLMFCFFIHYFKHNINNTTSIYLVI